MAGWRSQTVLLEMFPLTSQVVTKHYGDDASFLNPLIPHWQYGGFIHILHLGSSLHQERGSLLCEVACFNEGHFLQHVKSSSKMGHDHHHYRALMIVQQIPENAQIKQIIRNTLPNQTCPFLQLFTIQHGTPCGGDCRGASLRTILRAVKIPFIKA